MSMETGRASSQGTQAKTVRHALTVKIHVAKKDLRLDDGSYRDLLHRVTGQRTASRCNIEQLEQVVAELKRLGWAEKSQYRRRENAAAHVRLIYGLWNELRNLGALSDSSKSALRAFVQRQTKGPLAPDGVAAPEFLLAEDAQTVIEALKAWIRRVRERSNDR